MLSTIGSIAIASALVGGLSYGAARAIGDHSPEIRDYVMGIERCAVVAIQLSGEVEDRAYVDAEVWRSDGQVRVRSAGVVLSYPERSVEASLCLSKMPEVKVDTPPPPAGNTAL